MDKPSTPQGIDRPSDGGLALVEAAQLLGVGWIVVNQFRFHLGLAAGAHSGLVAKGYIGAGLYFVAGGFLVADLVNRLKDQRRFAYAGFVVKRLVYLYPLHILVIAAMAAVDLAGLSGAHRASVPFADLPANVLFVQAWGFVRTDTWNFPSWLASADWFVWLGAPLLGALAALSARRAALAAAAILAAFVAMFFVAQGLGVLFTDMTTRVGIVQATPAAMLGACLWRLHRATQLSARQGAVAAAGALLWILGGAGLRVSDVLIWPAFALLVLGLAAAGRAAWAVRRVPVLARLGDLSVAVQLVYLPTEILYFRLARAMLGPLAGVDGWFVLAGVFPVIALAGVTAHHLLQAPLARWLSERIAGGRGTSTSA